MIFPQEERDKFNKLKALLYQLTTFQQKMKVSTYYGEKFLDIVRGASQKLVGCDEQVQVCKKTEQSGSGEAIQLRRKGLVVEYGWTSTRYKDIPGLSTIMGKEYMQVVRGLRAMKAKSQNPEGVENLVEILEDMHKVGLFKGGGDADLEIKTTIKLGSRMHVQQSEEFDPTKDEDRNYWDEDDCDDVVVANKVKLNLDYNSMSFMFQQTKDKYWEIDGPDVRLLEYIRISEPAVYDTVTNVVENAILMVNSLVATKCNAYDAILEKYGQYLVLKEL